MVPRAGDRFGSVPDSCTAAKRCLLDNLVGAREQRSRDPEAERLGGLEIEGKPKHRWLFEWQVRRLSAFKDAIYEGGHACEAFIQIRTVRHQAAVARNEVILVDGRQPMRRRELKNALSVERSECIVHHE